ncbi:hypothetical protein RFI_16778 [Reticulomyxa filosa]|uniref:Uncharacterized protein n=1 Tax=Reticulomyxa filosa TaxID=46433 RepID=X6N3I6_RETFI|nr:hypothetical protein RFI_16778 [Reticulomyxa filosa]|eukprot:ETO20438.1 hypothetical protein RFI_16778 [Reticulomyxa filosa]
MFWDHFLDPFIIEVKGMKVSEDVDDFGSDFIRNWEGWPKWFIDNVIPQLTMAMLSNCKWPNNVDDQNQDQDQDREQNIAVQLDLIHSHRWECSDIIAKIAKIIGLRRLLQELFHMLTPLVNVPNPSPKVYAQIEAILFVIRTNYKMYEVPVADEDYPLKQASSFFCIRHIYTFI